MSRIKQENAEPSPNWVDSLGKNLQNSKMATALLEGHERFLLVAKARWLFLGFVAIYGACAGVGYIFSDFGWFLSTSQLVGLVVGVLLILIYNAIYYVYHKRLARLRYSGHLQVLLDYLCVTLLIHLSGGVASWFWPVYLLVTFEASVLVESRAQVYLLGMFAGCCYLFVLAGEYLNIIPYVNMPFIDSGLHHHAFFLVLMPSREPLRATGT